MEDWNKMRNFALTESETGTEQARPTLFCECEPKFANKTSTQQKKI